MALQDKLVNLADLKVLGDYTKEEISTLKSDLGSISDLDTTDKTSIVAAINEVASGVNVSTDTTLTESGVPADAKATGDAIRTLEEVAGVAVHEYTYESVSISRCSWDWTDNASGNFLKTEIKEVPQYIIMNKSVTPKGDGVAKSFSETSDFSTATYAPFSILTKGTYAADTMTPTYLYGGDSYKYMRLLLPNTTGLEVTYVYDTYRSENSYADDSYTVLGTSRLIKKIGFCNPKSGRGRAMVVVPYYKGKTYYFRRSGYENTLMSGDTSVVGIFDEAVFDESIPVNPFLDSNPSASTPFTYCRIIGNATKDTSSPTPLFSFTTNSNAEVDGCPKYLGFFIWQNGTQTVSSRATALETLMADANTPGWDAALDDTQASGDYNFVNFKESDYTIPFNVNPFSQSKWVLFGDSLQDQYGGRSYYEELPISKIAREYYVDFDNRAVSGTHICTGGSVDDSTHNGVAMLNALIDEVDNGADAPDYITFAYGSNGSASNTGTAESTSSDTDTTIGAMKYCIEQCRTNFPNAVIGFILPPQSTWNGNYGRNVAATREAMLACLQLDDYRVPYCDMWTESGITVAMLPDSIHISTTQSQNLYYHALRRFMLNL